METVRSTMVGTPPLVLELDEVGAAGFGCLGAGGPDDGHLFFGQDEIGVEGGQVRLLRPEDTGWDVPGETRHDFFVCRVTYSERIGSPLRGGPG